MNCLKRIKNIFRFLVVFLLLIFCYDFLNYNVFSSEKIWYKEDDPLKKYVGFDCDYKSYTDEDIDRNYYNHDALAISMARFEVTGENWGWGNTTKEMINQYMKLGDEAYAYGIVTENECNYYDIVTGYLSGNSAYNSSYSIMREQTKQLIELYQKRANATAKEKVETPDGKIIGDSKGDIEKITKGDKLTLTLEYGNELLDFINVTVKKDGVEVYNTNKTNKFEYIFSEKGNYHIEYNYSYLWAARYTEYKCKGSCTYESGEKQSSHQEYQLGFKWEIETYDIEVKDDKTCIYLNNFIDYVGPRPSEDNPCTNRSGTFYSTAGTAFEAGNSLRAYGEYTGIPTYNFSEGKANAIVSDAGDYVYFVYEIYNDSGKKNIIDLQCSLFQTKDSATKKTYDFISLAGEVEAEYLDYSNVTKNKLENISKGDVQYAIHSYKWEYSEDNFTNDYTDYFRDRLDEETDTREIFGGKDECIKEWTDVIFNGTEFEINNVEVGVPFDPVNKVSTHVWVRVKASKWNDDIVNTVRTTNYRDTSENKLINQNIGNAKRAAEKGKYTDYANKLLEGTELYGKYSGDDILDRVCLPGLESSDRFVVRKYDVLTDMYISGVGFKNYTDGGETKANFTRGSDYKLNDYKTNGGAELWSDIGATVDDDKSSTIRSSQSSATKKNSPAYVELGDYVEYTVEAKYAGAEYYDITAFKNKLLEKIEAVKEPTSLGENEILWQKDEKEYQINEINKISNATQLRKYIDTYLECLNKVQSYDVKNLAEVQMFLKDNENGGDLLNEKFGSGICNKLKLQILLNEALKTDELNSDEYKKYIQLVKEIDAELNRINLEIELEVELPDDRCKDLENYGLVGVYYEKSLGNFKDYIKDDDGQSDDFYSIKYNADSNLITIKTEKDRKLSFGETVKFVFIVPTDKNKDDKYRLGVKNPSDAYCDIASIKNFNGKDVSNITTDTEKHDYYAVKEYDVSVDSYISGVYHDNGEPNVYWTEDINDTKDTQVDGYRSRTSNAVKSQVEKRDTEGKLIQDNNSAYIDGGDTVEYTVYMINTPGKTTDGEKINPSVDRDITPWKQPNDVTVDLEFELPSGVSITSCKAKYFWDDTEYSITVKDNKIKGLNIGWAEYTELKLILSTDSVSNKYDDLKEIKATVTKVTNINSEEGYNTAKEVYKRDDGVAYNTSSDYFRVKEYNVSIDTYISNVYHNYNTTNHTGTESAYFTASDRAKRLNNSDKGYGDNGAGKEAYIEVGDVVEYTIKVNNIKQNYWENGTLDGSDTKKGVDAPYRIPGNAKVSLGTTITSLKSKNWGSKIEIYKGTEWVAYTDSTELSVDVTANSTSTIKIRCSTENVGNRYSDDLYSFSATIDSVKNTNSFAVNNASNKTSSSDYFRVKEYDVSVDTYISSVKHTDGNENGYWTADINGTSVEGYRQRLTNATKRQAEVKDESEKIIQTNNTAYIERGDIITYTIELSNTNNTINTSIDRNGEKYRQPDSINVKSIVLSYDVTTVIEKITIGEEIIYNKKENINKNNSIIIPPSSAHLYIKNINNITHNNNVKIKVELKRVYGNDYDNVYSLSAKVEEITNCNGKTGYNTAAGTKNANASYTGALTRADGVRYATSSDYFRVKEYNVGVDYYITKSEHTQSYTDGDTVTYNSDSRLNMRDKDKNPVYTEYGDIITYKIKVYNTTDATASGGAYVVAREGESYRNPENITLNLNVTLPKDYSDVKVNGNTATVNESGNLLISTSVGTNAVREITVSYKVENVSEEDNFTSTAQINGDILNCNSKEIQNNSEQTSSSDYYKLNDYNVSLDEYISTYNAEMANYNEDNGFTSGESRGFKDAKNDYSSSKPLDVEKYETLVFSTKVTNEASGETENKTDSYGKYATRARPTDVTQTLAQGLERIGYSATWYNSDGTKKQDITISSSGENNKYKYTIDDSIILSPGEYIIYYTTVKVTESNMCLDKLQTTSEITTLTNINRTTPITEGNNARIVTSRNIADKQSDSDCVRLKDLVIAGTVWLDANKDGYKNRKENGKNDVTVKLYKAIKNSDGSWKEEFVTSTTTNGNDNVTDVTHDANGAENIENTELKKGFYTFGRQPKADSNGNYYKYYIEFEYDGVKYKATEVYGGATNGQADGTGNLSAKVCQKCEILPNAKWNAREFLEFITDYPRWEVCSNCTTGYKLNEQDNQKKIIYDETKLKSCSNCNGIENNVFWYCNDHKAENCDDKAWRQGGGIPGETAGTAHYMSDSNAYEFDDVRNTFNEQYQTIGYNKSYIDTESVNDLSYTKDEHTSTLNENSSDSNRIMKARSFIKQDYNETVNESIENTNTLFLYGVKENDKYEYSNALPETEYLKYINLGLAEREEVNLSLVSDVSAVRTTVNGEQMTYTFDDNHDNDYVVGEAHNLDLYNSDYEYRYEDYYEGDVETYKGAESELNVEVTYKLTITNNAIENDEPNMKNHNIPVKAKAEQIAIYYDPSFMTFDKDKNVTVKVKDETTGLLSDKLLDRISPEDKISDSTTYKTYSAKEMEGYGVVYLDVSSYDYLKEGESGEVEITFIVNKDNKRQLDLQGSDFGHDIVAEISAYSTTYNSYRKGITNAGLIDVDSNPGNLGEKNKSSILNSEYYEDDTYRTGITINVPDNPDDPKYLERTISGFVWDDARSEQIGTEETGIQYIGNGEYNDSNQNNTKASTNPNDTGENKDKPISEVKVSLWEVVQKPKTNEKGEWVKDKDGNVIYEYYEYQAKNSEGYPIVAITNENGQYTLSDYIPGYYKVRFDYGYNSADENNVIYNGQDYKSTKYYNGGYYTGDDYKTDNIGSSNNFSYFDKVKSALDVVNKSDAQDDEIRRLNVNSYSETMTTNQAQIFDEAEAKNAHAATLINNTKMYAESTIFYAKPDNVELSSDKEIDASQTDFNKTRLWKIESLDFGLEYRPEASVVLDKNIESLELVTSDNKTLVKLYFEEDKDGNRLIDESRSIGYENVQFLANQGKSQQGFVYINMDTDILEGCTVKVDYEMEAENNSEVDRINQNLDVIKYEYGAAVENYNPEDIGYVSQNYSANGTAANVLANEYYENYKFDSSTGNETYAYLKQLKKPYISSGETKINNTLFSEKLAGTGYYGMYLGETYYTGNVGDNDVVAQLKVDQILDYVDNDFVFDLSENNTKDRTWRTTTSEELLKNKILDTDKVYSEYIGDKQYLIDKANVRYDTENRTNLILSVDTNKQGNGIEKGNVSLSRFLNTKKATTASTDDYTGKINAIVSKILSAEDVAKGTGLNYENISEVVQYTSLTGRRTTLPKEGNGGVIGNANVYNWNGYTDSEDDTDATEVITIAPPTGLVEK